MPNFKKKSKGFKMKGSTFYGKSPIKQSKKIIGEDTYEAEENKNKGQLELGLSTTGGSSQPGDTKERLILKKGDNVPNTQGGKTKKGDFIDQYFPMEIQQDSVGRSGNTYYSLKKK